MKKLIHILTLGSLIANFTFADMSDVQAFGDEDCQTIAGEVFCGYGDDTDELANELGDRSSIHYNTAVIHEIKGDINESYSERLSAVYGYLKSIQFSIEATLLRSNPNDLLYASYHFHTLQEAAKLLPNTSNLVSGKFRTQLLEITDMLDSVNTKQIKLNKLTQVQYTYPASGTDEEEESLKEMEAVIKEIREKLNKVSSALEKLFEEYDANIAQYE